MNEKNKDMLTLKINGNEVAVPRGSTILEAAEKAGIEIPTLCHDERLKPFGACRMCLVEIEGRGKLVTACSTPAEDGISVITSNPRIDKLRRTVLELLAVYHPIDCPICDKAGECRLQELTVELRQEAKRRFEGYEKRIEKDRRNPLVERDMSRCVGCGKCVRICAEVQGTSAIDFQHRGFNTSIGPAFGEPLQCDFCGQCIDICPVGALQNKQYKFTTRSWLLKKHDAVCSFCGDGCVIELGVGQKGDIVRGKGLKDLGYNRGNLCQRGRFGHDYLQSPNRVGEPLLRREGELQPAGWEEAVARTAEKLAGIKAKYGGDAVGFLVGGRIDNEALYAFSKLAGDVVESRRIASSSMRKYKGLINVTRDVWKMKPPALKVGRPLQSDVILVLESEINATNPLAWVNIHTARMKKGATLVVADSRRTKAGWRADRYMKVSPGGGVELILRIASTVIKRGLYDRNAAQGLEGFDKFAKEASMARPVLTDEILDADIAWLAGALARAKDPLLVITMDASENVKSEQLLRAAADLAVLLGKGPRNILVPVPESNMRSLVDSEIMSGAESEDPAAVIKDILGGRIKALYVLGDDPVSHLPEMSSVRKALLSLEFLVVQDIMLSPVAAMADAVLPAAAWSEHGGSYTSGSGVIQSFGKAVAPPGAAKPDWEILSMVAKAMDRDLGLGSVEEIRRSYVERWFPGAKILKAGVYSGEDLEEEASGAGAPPAAGMLEVGYTISPPTLAAGELMLVTGPMRGHSGILSTYSGAITSVFPEPVASMHPDDALGMGVEDGDSINVRSSSGEISIKVRHDEEIKKGVIFIPVHFTEPPVLDLFTNDACLGGMPVKVRITPLAIPRSAEARQLLH